MNSFTIHTPTQIFFGEDQAESFAAAAAQIGRHALLVTGGGTVERLGYQKIVTDALSAAGVAISHFSGIEPNPEFSTVNRAAAQARRDGVDFILALGGGSAIDAAKAIAALVHSGDDNIWPYMIGGAKAFQLTGALPIVVVTTTAATASEVTPFSVISNRIENGKSFLMGEFLKPKAAWLNPAFTIGLSPVTTADGAADILSHVFENYIVGGNGSPLADRYSEAVMATVLETLPKLLANPGDVAARGDLLWASTLALNDYQNAGRRPGQYVLHFIEHALSAFRHELAHGRGLATIYPAYFRWLIDHDRAVDRFAQLGARLFGLTGTEAQRANGFVEHFEQWLTANHLTQSLEDLGFSESNYEAIATYSVKIYGDGRQLDAVGPLPVPEIVNILKATARQSLAAAV